MQQLRDLMKKHTDAPVPAWEDAQHGVVDPDALTLVMHTKAGCGTLLHADPDKAKNICAAISPEVGLVMLMFGSTTVLTVAPLYMPSQDTAFQGSVCYVSSGCRW